MVLFSSSAKHFKIRKIESPRFWQAMKEAAMKGCHISYNLTKGMSKVSYSSEKGSFSEFHCEKRALGIMMRPANIRYIVISTQILYPTKHVFRVSKLYK